MSYITPETLFEREKVVPVVVLKTLDETLPTLGALKNGGINVAEITFRTACAKDAIRVGCEAFPDMCIGAGTVLNAAQAEDAIAAGAKFIVSPGLSESVAEVCRREDIPYIPGCVTPTEIMAALELGIHVIKFFPANVYGGLSAIRALAAPFTAVKFLPTGGVDLSNLSEFLACDKIVAVGGSFMMKGNIEANCRKIKEVLK